MPFEVPENWEWVKLGYLCDYGKNEKASPSQVNENAWILDLEDIEKDTGKLLKRVHKSEKETKSIRNTFKKGDVLYSKLRTYLNKVLVADFEGYCTTEILPLDFNGFVVPEFARHVLMSNYFLEYTAKCCYGVKMPRLGTNDGRNAPFSLPPLAEQHHIVSEIERYFALIDEIEANKSDLQTAITQTKSKVLDLAVRGKLVPQDPNDESASVVLERISKEQKAQKTTADKFHYPFEVPDGWVWCKLGDILDIKSSKRVHKSEWKKSGIPFYRAREIIKLAQNDFVDNDLFISEEHYLDLKDKYGVPKENDILISAVGSIGKTYIVKKTDKFYYKDASVLCLSNSHSVNSSFIEVILATDFLQSQMYKNSKGTTVDTITIEKANQYIFPFPPLAEQQRIVTKIEDIFNLLDKIQESL